MPRDAGATRERILAAAVEEFSERGLAGARVDGIAARAGCNKALLYQHFEDKDALYREVLFCKMAQISEIAGAAGAAGSTGPSRPDPLELMGTIFDYHAANPWFARLLQWEALDFGGEAISNEDERRARHSLQVRRLEQLQQDGQIDASLDAAQVLLTLMAIDMFWFMAPQLVRLVTGKDPADPAALAERREHVLECARRMLLIPPTERQTHV